MEKKKAGLHPRNIHRAGYDFEALTGSSPELSDFVIEKHGKETIDFSDGDAVKALNRALLIHYYGMELWDLPEGYLCPAVPGRADYIHHLADLLAEERGGEVPRGKSVRVLDIGVGASCIYPVIGHAAYGWSFVGSEADPPAYKAASHIASANRCLKGAVDIRLQPSSGAVFEGIIRPGESFAAAVCNPPFYASGHEAREATARKWKKLGRAEKGAGKNFGGRSRELWHPGGEKAFISNMIRESLRFSGQCAWFSSLVSQKDSLPFLQKELKRLGFRDVRILEMKQGQKASRALAWKAGQSLC